MAEKVNDLCEDCMYDGDCESCHYWQDFGEAWDDCEGCDHGDCDDCETTTIVIMD